MIDSLTPSLYISAISVTRTYYLTKVITETGRFITNNNKSLHVKSWCWGGLVTRLLRWVSLVEQELLTLPEHLRSPPVFSGISLTRSLILYACFADRCLSFCTVSFGRCVVCMSSIYGFWLTLWYPQTFFMGESLDCYQKMWYDGKNQKS